MTVLNGAGPDDSSEASVLLRSLRSSMQRQGGASALLWLTRGPEGTWQPEHLSFKEVWSRGARAGEALRELGLEEKRGCRIGVAVDEGPLLPLLELGVLLSGGAIVPLDPCEPHARLASVLEDAELSLAIVKDASAAASLEAAAALAFPDRGPTAEFRPRIVLASDVPGLSALQEASEGKDEKEDTEGGVVCQLPDVSSSAISHIFFTSGSTGRPKGCVVTHRSLASYCEARNAMYRVTESAVSFVASAHTFDPSLGDIMATWMAGGCIALAPRAEIFAQLGPLLAASEATHLLCTPSLFATLLGTRHQEPQALPRLREVALGGEPTPPAVLEVWAGRHADDDSGLRLWNTYGVTECCVYNAARTMRPGDLPSLLGKPLPGNHLLIVVGGGEEDEDESIGAALGKVDAEEVGELAIAGIQVGEGYVRRPELTARRFLCHPELGRVYLSGDLARKTDGGEIALLGRRDHQVKVRGHRIELGEVEHWIWTAAGPLVSAVAAACLDGRLVAFFVPAAGCHFATPLPSRVRGVLRSTLRWLSEREVPRQMRPQRYVLVQELPLTVSGKVARGSLAELLASAEDEEEVDSDDDGLPGGAKKLPLEGFEAVVAEIWAAELAQSPGSVGRRSHFQELGGHSIAALRVCRRLLVRLSSACQATEPGGPAPAEVAVDDEALGGDLGELAGAFAPQELLLRPRFSDYVAYLRSQGVDGSVSATLPEEIERGPALESTPESGDEGGAADGEAVSMLQRAAACGAVGVIEFLVGKGLAPVDGRCSMRRLRAATRAQRSLRNTGKDGLRPPAPLHIAAAGSSCEAVAALLRLGANVTATEAHGVMALHLSAGAGPAEAVRFLLDAKAPLAAKDLNQQTVLHFAARSGNAETLALLLARWLEDESIASQGARVYGGALDWRDRWHRTPVHWAALNGHTSALRALLEGKANPAPPRVTGYKHAKSTTLRHESPLEIAERRGQLDVAELLRLHGARPESGST